MRFRFSSRECAQEGSNKYIATYEIRPCGLYVLEKLVAFVPSPNLKTIHSKWISTVPSKRLYRSVTLWAHAPSPRSKDSLGLFQMPATAIQKKAWRKILSLQHSVGWPTSSLTSPVDSEA